MIKVAVGNQEILDAIRFDAPGLDVLEKLDVRIAAPCVNQSAASSEEVSVPPPT
jgi:hypothetical protein